MADTATETSEDMCLEDIGSGDQTRFNYDNASHSAPLPDAEAEADSSKPKGKRKKGKGTVFARYAQL